MVEPPPPGALQFMHTLQCLEKTTRSFAVPPGQPQSEEESDLEEEVWRGKVASFARHLTKQLDGWVGLSSEAAEQYRIRIENLSPLLEFAFEERKRALVVASQPPDVDEPVHPAQEDTLESMAPEVSALETSPAPDSHSSEPATAARAVEDSRATRGTPHSSGAGASKAKADAAAAAASRLAPVASGDGALAWRRRRHGGGAGSKEAKEQMEEEMVGLAEGMKGAANTFLMTLQKDNKKLDVISDKVDKGLDKVDAENKKGRELLWSSQLSFMCTMIMVIISVVIFFMMLPFIFWT